MKKKKVVIFTAAIIILLISAGFYAVYSGLIQINNPSRDKYPVRGVDVSVYQGEIDWEIIKNQKIDFAFIKATEGSSHKDRYFDDNYKNAAGAGVRAGAYHFFSFDSSGATQAENFIATVEKVDNMLPPVVDVEFYGDKNKNRPEKTDVTTELSVLLERLEEHYGVKPLIYTTQSVYTLYIEDDFGEYDLWIRGVYSKPDIKNREWKFWQYSNRGRLDGYSGEEKFIDLNVFNGTREEFENYGLK